MTKYSSVILLHDHRMLLQLRDNKPGIRYPGIYALFGGKIEEGETPLQAMQREVMEELGLHIEPSAAIKHMVFDWKNSFNKYHTSIRNYYPNADELLGYPLSRFEEEIRGTVEVDNLFIKTLTDNEFNNLWLNEGRSMDLVSYDAAKALLAIPLDKMMILCYLAENHLVTYQEKTPRIARISQI
jgi:8-oxo-dGTP pyrophosphatase MutT (NUDIX family)